MKTRFGIDVLLFGHVEYFVVTALENSTVDITIKFIVPKKPLDGLLLLFEEKFIIYYVLAMFFRIENYDISRVCSSRLK